MSRNPYSRRQFLRSSAVLGAAAVASPYAGSLAVAAPSADRPNILIVLGDDHTYSDLGCYGNPLVRTPNMDKLAAEGMRFTRAFTATAMCAPTRQQLYTGIFPVRNGAYPNHSRVYPGVKTLPQYFQQLGYRVGLSGKGHFGPKESYPFEILKGQGVDFDSIREFVSRDAKQPFCLLVCSSNPHEPWKEGDPSLYDPAKLTVPPYLVDTPETRSALTRYYGEVAALDDEVGRCMDLVREAGAEPKTLFIYTSEQGAQMPFGKWTCYDVGLRVALIARWPGRVAPGSVAEAMVQYVDVVPTLLEAAGGEPVAGLDGSSFLAVLEGKTDKHADAVYGVHTTRGIIAATPEGYPVRSIRTEKYKYILNLNPTVEFRNTLMKSDGEKYWNSWIEKAKTDPAAARLVDRYRKRPAEEFYDIVADPYELNNLADEPRYRPLMDEMRQKLEAWMRQQGDEGMATELRARERQGSGKKANEKEKKAGA